MGESRVNTIAQPDGVARGVASGVVVEIGKDVDSIRYPPDQPVGPGVQPPVLVATSVLRRPEMESDVDAWADDAPDMLETAVVAAFEDSGRIGSVSRYGGGSRGDFALVLELRAFESVYRGPTPDAVVEVQARLVDLKSDRVSSKRFLHTVPVAGVEVPQVVTAFGDAMSASSRDIVGWALVEGQRLRTDAVE